MPYLDIIIAIPILWGMFRGFRRGFIIEICTLMALILGIYGAVTFGDMARDYLIENYNTDHQMSMVLAFAILFILIVIVVFMFGKVLEGLIKMVALGLVNKIFGMIFGGAKFALIVSALLFLFEGFPATRQLLSDETKNKSYLYEPVAAMATTFYPVLSEHKWQDQLHEKFEDLKEKIES